jgi:predicted RNA binding protein YcfA (HicA-like mRNA interferase family)
VPKNIPSLKSRELIKILRKGGCEFYREGKGDHNMYFRLVNGMKRVVPIDMGQREFSPAYVTSFEFLDNLVFPTRKSKHS